MFHDIQEVDLFHSSLTGEQVAVLLFHLHVSALNCLANVKKLIASIGPAAALHSGASLLSSNLWLLIRDNKAITGYQPVQDQPPSQAVEYHTPRLAAQQQPVAYLLVCCRLHQKAVA